MHLAELQGRRGPVGEVVHEPNVYAGHLRPQVEANLHADQRGGDQGRGVTHTLAVEALLGVDERLGELQRAQGPKSPPGDRLHTHEGLWPQEPVPHLLLKLGLGEPTVANTAAAAMPAAVRA